MRLLHDAHEFLVDPTRYARAPEYVVGGATAVWGALLALPADTFKTSTAWAILQASPIGELGWGLIFLALGLLQLIAVLRRWHQVRRDVALLAVAHWSAVGFSFWTVNPYSTGWVAYLLMYAMINLLTFLRLSQRGVI